MQKRKTEKVYLHRLNPRNNLTPQRKRWEKKLMVLIGTAPYQYYNESGDKTHSFVAQSSGLF
jgi:hypothetical protein